MIIIKYILFSFRIEKFFYEHINFFVQLSHIGLDLRKPHRYRYFTSVTDSLLKIFFDSKNFKILAVESGSSVRLILCGF